MSLIRKHGAVLQAWACLDLVSIPITKSRQSHITDLFTRNSFFLFISIISDTNLFFHLSSQLSLLLNSFCSVAVVVRAFDVGYNIYASLFAMKGSNW